VSADLSIVHLYPDLLRTYGDRANVLVLQRRAEWRGFSVSVVGISRGEPTPDGAGVILLGGGSDRVQSMIGPDLKRRTPELMDAAVKGSVILGVCGGYQLLGHKYVAADGAVIEGMGLLDVTTVGGTGRIIGRVHGVANLYGKDFEFVGFENHGGRTTLGPKATPLGTVGGGQGNNGKDKSEGAVQGRTIGTYLHGPLMPANPSLADAVLEQALSPLTGGAPLAPLDDSLEKQAFDHARKLKR